MGIRYGLNTLTEEEIESFCDKKFARRIIVYQFLKKLHMCKDHFEATMLMKSKSDRHKWDKHTLNAIKEAIHYAKKDEPINSIAL